MDDQAYTSLPKPAVASARAPSLSRTDSTQIDLLRIGCIFLMLSVHVYPHAGHDTILRGGSLHGVWYVYVDLFGRASVAVLSFLAGYIFWINGRKRAIGQVARDRFFTLLLPMITWNVIFALLMLTLAIQQNRDLTIEFARHGAQTPIELISAFTALANQPINLPLAFLRDLFVSVLFARLAFPWLRRFGPFILGLLVVMALYRLGEPVFLRPSIPLFVFCGAYVAARGISLATVSDIRIVWPLGLMFVVAFSFAHSIPDLESQFDEEALNLTRRAILIVIFLVLARMVVDRCGPINLAWLRPLVFLAFLSHAIVNQALGEAWEFLGLGTHSLAYVGFFFANAPIDFAVALVGTLVLGRLPRWVQLTFSGSTRATARSGGTLRSGAAN